MIPRTKRITLSFSLAMSLGIVCAPLGCGSAGEVATVPVTPTPRYAEVPEYIKNQLADCVKQISTPFPPAEGNRYAINFNVQISESGRISAAEVKDSTLGGHEAEACFIQALYRATLPMRTATVQHERQYAQDVVVPQSRAFVGFAWALPLIVIVWSDVAAALGISIGVGIIAYAATTTKTSTPQCLPCFPVPVGGTAHDYHSAEAGNDPHDGMANHTHHFLMQQSPPVAGCRCFWKRNFVSPTPGFSPLPGAVPVSPATGGGISP
jgi:hypothetical protein